MNVYQTDAFGYFAGVTSADQDPLDLDNWLIPAGCVEVEPPALKDGFLIVWSGSEWSYEAIPEPEVEPEPTQEEVEAKEKADRISLLKINLRETDYVALPDYDQNKADVLADRQSWREEIRTLEGN